MLDGNDKRGYTKSEVRQMEIRLLRYFLAAAREENITRAAESLHISQPSLSKQLMELEREIGKPLLVRGKRKVTLTEEGVLLRKRADEIVALVEKTERELSADSAKLGGEVAVGGSPTAAVFRAAASLRRKHPELRFRFYGSDATDVLERLEHGSLDLAVLLEPVDTTKYESISLGDSARWGLILPEGSRLAEKDSVEREELCGVPLIIHNRIGLQREIAHWAQTEPERLNIAATYNVVNGDPTPFVQNGLGYFLVADDHLPQRMSPGFCFRPLSPALEVHHALVRRRYAVPAKPAEALWQEVKKEVK